MSSPREGWLSLGLLIVMMVAVAWSVETAAWLDSLAFLVPLAVVGVLAGGLLALTRLSVVITLSAGAFLGAALVVWTVGAEYRPALDGLGRVLALRDNVLLWLGTVVVGGYPSQIVIYALGLGVLMWSTGFMSAYALFRHHRALDSVLLAGAALIVNMSATYTDLIGYLIIFVLAALLLLLRVSLAERQMRWHARRVVETDEVPGTIMRGGVVFIGVSLLLAWTLTSVAVAAPLSDAWRNLDTVWRDASVTLDRLFGTVQTPTSRVGGAAFGSSFAVQGAWVSRDEVVMEVAATDGYYMRAVTYDRYTGRGWQRSEGRQRTVGVAEPIFPPGSPEWPTQIDAFERVTITVEIAKPTGRNVFTPGFPVQAFIPVVVHEAGGAALLGGLEAASPVRPGDGYQVTAEISQATERQLSEAGTDYPAEVAALYTDAGAATQRTRDLALAVVTEAGATDPYTQARALSDFLRRDPTFTYATEAPLPDDPSQDLVDFFLFDEAGRVGYCEYYASAMVVLARTLGLPARMAVGFAPGTPSGPDLYTVRERDAHAWAEIYFPGYGWQVFEATKSVNPGFGRLSGEDPSLMPNLQRPGIGGVDPRDDLLGETSSLPTFRPIDGGTSFDDPAPADQARRGNGLVIGLIALVGLGAAILVHRRSAGRWSLLSPNERAWRRMELGAVRAGVRQRPTETVYEYSSWLEEQIPTRRPEIRTIASGKVWSDYSGRPTSDERLARIARAWRRLRRPLWLLAVRRRLGGLLRRS